MTSEKIEKEKIEKELEELLGIETGDLRDEIIEKAVWLRKDPLKFVAVRIFPDGTYDVGIGQEGSYDGYDSGERLWAEFSLIEPWDLPEYETVIENEDGDGYVDQDNGDVFEDDDELLEAVRTTVSSGFYGRFEEEWKKFLGEFDEWYNAIRNTEKEWAENFKKKLAQMEKEKAEWKAKTKRELTRSLEEFLTNEYEIIALYESGKIRFAHSLDELPDDHNEHADDDVVMAGWMSKQKILKSLEGVKDKHEALQRIADDWCKFIWGE